jgi:hypothetical protein
METESGRFDFRPRNLESADARGGVLKWLVAVRCPTTSLTPGMRRVLLGMKPAHLPANERHGTDPTDPINT